MWIKSKFPLVLIELVGNEDLVCFAWGQIGQIRVELEECLIKLNNFIGDRGKCPSRICQRLTFERSSQKTGQETGIKLELLPF